MPKLRRTVFLSLLLLLQSSIAIIAVAVILNVKYSGLIQQGITVNGIPVGGISTVEAAYKLESSLPFPSPCIFQIEKAGKKSLIDLTEIDGKYSYLLTAEEALKYAGIKGRLPDRLLKLLNLRAAPADLAPKISYSESKLREKIKMLASEWKENPKNASVVLIDARPEIIPEKYGYILDVETTYNNVGRALESGQLSAEAAGQIIRTDVTTADLDGINSLLAEYTTAFDSSAGNRTHNIITASEMINGTVLKPGQIFSLNRKLGPRLAETGYLKAPVYIGGRLIPDFGGGICQVASTLYNTVLLSDLEVIERFTHPFPVNYVSPGRDATIAGDHLDFKFANNTDCPVYLSSSVESGTITIRIYGAEKNNGREIRITTEKKLIEPKVVMIKDDTLPEGEILIKEPGRAGYEVRVYREIFLNSRLESKELISTDYYRSYDKIILTGPSINGKNK